MKRTLLVFLAASVAPASSASLATSIVTFSVMPVSLPDRSILIAALVAIWVVALWKSRPSAG